MNYLNEHTYIYLNGDFVKAQTAGISLYEQTLHYGYGAFEGIRAYNTHNGARLFKAEEHFNRLEQSCKLLGIPYHWNNSYLIEQTYRLLEINNIRSAYIRPLVVSGQTLFHSLESTSSIMITAWEWGPYLGHSSLRVTLSDYQLPHPLSAPPEAKITGQYVTAILASKAAVEKGFQEALLTDVNGYVAQAAGANLFIEKNYKLYTPRKGSILPGITRATVMEICARFHIDVIEKEISVEELKNADSAFLCGTAAEIIGITAVDEVVFPEPWTETLGAMVQRTYKNLVLEKENYEVII